ncbi:MAG: DAK2 domain-containing protein [Actinobacteria bacterium]|nr:DAK2 domain-containing protein [Actinomycetota bacterium]
MGENGAGGRKSGRSLQHAVETSLRWLELNAAAIDRLNVFPVPDGDTGTNMVLTLRAALDRAAALESDAVSVVAHALARGALLGARGNSGVILSQILRGLSDGLAGLDSFGPREFAKALQSAYRVAYESVSNPVEGTILTVARDAGEAAMGVVSVVETVEELIMRVVDAARRSVEHTPEQLPVLKEAGVVDAGGQGLYIILEGMQRYLHGEPLPQIATPGRAADVFAAFVEAHRTDEHGFCTEFLVHGERLDAGQIRAEMAAFGGSLLVVGDESVVRVHVHTERPAEAITAAMRYGQLDKLKADNMDLQQAAHFAVAAPAPPQAVPPTPPADVAYVVAVASGEGMAGVFRSYRASVVPGGQSMNPSTGDILTAIEASGAPWTVVLPNNSNVILTARVAASQATTEVHVVPTRSMPQGVAALLAFNPALDAATNVRAMQAAAEVVTTLEVTRAVRDAAIGDVRVRKGQYIGLVDDRLVAGDGDANGLVLALFKRLADHRHGIATIYAGRPAPSDQVHALVARLHGAYPHLQIETVDGGQDLYDYIIALE